jgi:hypothetical protein
MMTKKGKAKNEEISMPFNHNASGLDKRVERLCQPAF